MEQKHHLSTDLLQLVAQVARPLGAHATILCQQARVATVTSYSATMIDVVVPDSAPRLDLDDGPIPTRALVDREDELTGEIVVWVRAGRLIGLEQAWYTDEPPIAWPLPDAVRVTGATEGTGPFPGDPPALPHHAMTRRASGLPLTFLGVARRRFGSSAVAAPWSAPRGSGAEIVEEVVDHVAGPGTALPIAREVSHGGEVRGTVGRRAQERGERRGCRARQLRRIDRPRPEDELEPRRVPLGPLDVAVQEYAHGGQRSVLRRTPARRDRAAHHWRRALRTPVDDQRQARRPRALTA